MPPTVPTGQALPPVTITFSSPDAQPPIFVAGDFTEPRWAPELMDFEDGKGEARVFKKTFHVPAGQYQYKFRLGAGDWWVCDNNAKTVETDDGITNNLLVVEEELPETPKPADSASVSSSQDFFSAPHTQAPTGAASGTSTKVPSVSNFKVSDSNDVPQDASKYGPMHVNVKPTEKQTNDLQEKFTGRGHDPYAGIGDDVATPMDGPGAPLLPHEIGAPPPTPPEEQVLSASKLSPIPGSPADASKRRPSGTSHKSRSSSIVPLAPTAEDLNDPTVERFPEGRQEVLKRIQTLKQQIPEDETRDLEAVTSETESVSEISADDFDDALPKPVTAGAGLELAGKGGADAEAKSHEHLDSVPEYDEPSSPLRETGTESVRPGSKSETSNGSPILLDLPSVSLPAFDGSSDEQAPEAVSLRETSAQDATTQRDHAFEDESSDDYDDARSDTHLLLSKQVGFFTGLWRRVQNALVRFWQIVAGGFLKPKSE